MSATACTWRRQGTSALSAALTPEHTLSSTAADSTVEVFIAEGSMEEDSMVADFTEVGTADTAGNLSVISYKFYVLSSTYKETDAVRLGLGPEIFSGLKPLPFADNRHANNLQPIT
jgi:hypothetical protein